MNFSTKANTLELLGTKLKKSKVEKVYSFSVSNWMNKTEVILSEIEKKFSDKIVVRSSAMNEDSAENSMAGYFESVLNVNSENREDIKRAVNKVIKSYNEKKSSSAFNQVLVQSMSKDIAVSGVVFTRGLENNSPYYVINYDDSTFSTDSVTGGVESKSVKIFKYLRLENNYRFSRLVDSVKEIERLFNNGALDVEFAINKKGEIIIFQVRPITLKRDLVDKESMVQRKNNLQKRFFLLSKEERNLYGKRTIFADMPDWNPAEILGDNPGYLDYSLYDYIITNEAWHVARTTQGYYNIRGGALCYLFGNKPYVDVRKSFNSFLPAKLNSEVRKKLVSFYLTKLRDNPELQDKVEFEVLYTCYDFSIEEKIKELIDLKFSNKEIDEIKMSLIDLTNNLIINSKTSIDNDVESCKKLERIRKSISFNNDCDIVFESLKYVRILLDDCKKHGTVQFSRLARLGFVGKIILKSLVKCDIISQKTFDDFFKSINTVATDFTKDFNKFMDKKTTKNDFIKKYGHLRPGTYDITSQRYDKNTRLVDPVKFNIHAKESHKKFRLDKKTKERIDVELQAKGLQFNAEELFEFVKKATEARELSKFEFTKNLSDAIELIAIAGNEMGFSRHEMSFLSVSDLFVNVNDRISLTKSWKKKILIRKKERYMNERVILPPIIFSRKDFDIIEEYTPKPNFITQRKISSKTFFIINSSMKNINLSNRIVLIENADPGYDWIFTKNIAGLITKYGGVASHMSIRCAEFGIPAAIGCGSLFNKLNNVEELTLDCKLKKVIPLKLKE